MSIRSTFEFNHDCAHKIERDPEQFVADLLNYAVRKGMAAALQEVSRAYHSQGDAKETVK
jgi:hypothetical protein